MIFADAKPADTSSRSIVELAATHLCHPCFAVAQAAQRSLGKLLLQGMPGATGRVNGLSRQVRESPGGCPCCLGRGGFD